MVKGKILGLLAVALMAGPMAADAAYLYTFGDSQTTPSASLSFTVDDFVSTSGVIAFTPQTIGPHTFNSAAASICGVGVTFVFTSGSITSVNNCGMSWSGDAYTTLSFLIPQAVGSFTAGGWSRSGSPLPPLLNYLTISTVPEPGTLALLGLGLAGLGMSRRRKAT